MLPLVVPRGFSMGRGFSASPFVGRNQVQIAGQRPRSYALGQAPAGSQAEVLRTVGPIIEVIVGNSAAVAEKMKAEGKTVPPPKTIKALIDTGASISAIDQAAAVDLQLLKTGSASIGGVGGSSSQPVFAAMLELPDSGTKYDPLTLAGANLGVPDFQMLIGRNILCRHKLIYDGPTGTFKLERIR